MGQHKVSIIVPARAGSKGLKDKNLIKLNGESLISIAIRQGHLISNNVYVTTDIERKKIDTDYHYHYFKRQKELCMDSTNMIDVVIDVIENNKLHEHEIVLMQPTTPLRNKDVIKKFLKTEIQSDEILLTVCETEFNTLKSGVIENGKLKALNSNEDFFSNRQKLKKTYKTNGALYKFHALSILKAKSFNLSKLIPIVMNTEYSIDIDTIEDIDKCRRMFERYNEDFSSDWH